MEQLKSGYVDIGDAKLYYEMDNDGETLVLLHAGFLDSGMWDSQWIDFTKDYRVVRFDMRGFGKSDIMKAPAVRREDLYEALKQLDIQQAHLLGCSLGGEIVIDFALEHPEMVSSLITVSAVPSGFEMQGAPPQLMLDMMEIAKAGDLAKTSEAQIRLWVDGEHRTPAQVDGAIRQQALEMNKIVLANGTEDFDMQPPVKPMNPPAVKRLKDIKCPTLVIVGALDNSEIQRAGDVMAQEISGAQKVVIEGGAHVPNMDNPAQFNAAVLRFLDAQK